MSTDPDTELLRIAEAVSDAESVDWDDNDVLDAIRFLQEMRKLP